MKLSTFLGIVLTTALLWSSEEPSNPELKVGAAAPAFRLNDHAGRAVSIGGDRERWTVVAFYPKALTPG